MAEFILENAILWLGLGTDRIVVFWNWTRTNRIKNNFPVDQIKLDRKEK